MTNPTSNYGFVLPTPTDLVTDLPADFEVALQGVDTRLKALQPGTTLGDIAYSSATANTNTRLGIGTTGQVLTVAGGVPSWATASAGGLTLINSGGTSLTGASVTIGSIPQTYKELYLWFENVSGATDEDMFIRLNADTGSNYLSAFTRGASSIVNTADSSFRVASFSISSSRAKNTFGQLRLPLYTETSGIQSGLCNYYSGYHEVAANGQVAYSKSAAITSITLVASGTTFDAGTAYLYGVS